MGLIGTYDNLLEKEKADSKADVENRGVEKVSVSDETKFEEIRAGVQLNTPMIYCGVIPEKFEIGLIEINRCAMNCEYYGLKKFFKVYGFTEIEIYALRTGYDFDNHELIFPLSENIFDKELEEKIECCKVKFNDQDTDPKDYYAIGEIVRYVQWFLGSYDIVNKFKIDDLKKGGLLKGILY